MSSRRDPDAVLHLALRSARVGTWTRDLGSDSVEWSAELSEIFGFEEGPQQRPLSAFLDLIHPDDRAALAEAEERAIRERGDYSIEFRFRHTSGEWRWMSAFGAVTCDDARRPVQLYGIGMDVSERKRSEYARAHLAAIVESSDDAIVSKTLEGRVLSWNVGAERLFGYTADEMIGQPITRIIPVELHQEEVGILTRLRRGERIERYETVRVAKDGRRIDVSLTVSPVRDDRGVIVGASKIAHDIGARKRAEAALRESEARLRNVVRERERLLASERAARADAERLSHIKDEFLATLSHELRTPLNAIQGWASLLRQPNLKPEDRTRGIETIERNARAQAKIINDLLDMSRIVSGKIHLEVRSLHLQDVIAAAVEAVRPSAEAKRIRLHTLLDSGIGATRGDPNRLQQVLWNLLTNAVKFTPPGGRIQVILERVNSHAEIVVEDTGVGIRPEFLPHVFDRFRQGDASTTRRYGGLGLGLSIVRNLVELHGGSVRVKSAGENQGSTFIVSLPLSISGGNEGGRSGQQAGASSDEVRAIDLPTLEGIRVLVVEDDSDARTLVMRILEGRGAQVIGVESVQEALDTVRREHIDLVMSDVGMPEMDGYDLIRRLRALDAARGGRIPAIAVTAYARAEDRQRLLLAGYQMHIPKPIESGELIAAIASLLKVSR